jgi:hypothetical protein
MADLRCPMCGKPNSDELETCAFCGARLKPLLASSPENRLPIHPGEELEKQKTSEMKRGTAPFGEPESIQAGDVPTRKNTAELESALPSWLRDLRGQDSQTPPAQPAKPFADEGWPFPSGAESASQPADAKLPDWLSGLETGAKEEKEVPDWLASIRDKSPIQPETPVEEEPFTPPEGTDWLGRLSQQEKEKPAPTAGGAPPFPPESKPTASALLEGLPDWFTDQKSEPAPARPGPIQAAPAEAKPPEELPTWLAGLQAEPEKDPAVPPTGPKSAPSEELPDWLMKLQVESKTPTHELPNVDIPFEDSPDWLAKLQASASAEEKKPPVPGAVFEATSPAEIPTPELEPLAETPDWLANLPPIVPKDTEKTVASIFTPIPSFTTETKPPAEEIPDWLAKFETEAAPAQEEPAAQALTSPPETKPGEEPAKTKPDWLAEFEEGAVPTEVPSPAAPQEAALPAGEREANLLMETPDWLSTLKPEGGEKKAPAGAAEKPEIAPAELPSWVQAMRPVEAVMAESKAPQEEEKEEAAVGGPLAGLSGVLPLSPGLGPLRKPQAYSAKLQMTEGQQRHAASLERLVAAESEPRPLLGQTHLRSASFLRWIIALVLILAAGLPLATGIQTVPGAVYPSELSTTRDLINGLRANPPVLLLFDYEPAFSGELEAAAAPVLEHLLFKGPRLAILSTSPTGPILADSFMKRISHPPEYVNLGYLAGGAAGVLGFAENPPAAATYTLEGAPAWQMPTLQGVQNLSDFAAVIVLTDNADTGRTWIEQAGPYLNTAPMIMVISAQAEPMIRPYYDSGQIKGLVTGLAGGKAYEQANEQAFQGVGLARRYWDAFSAGLFLAEVMILVGGLWSVIAAWRARRSKTQEGA